MLLSLGGCDVLQGKSSAAEADRSPVIGDYYIFRYGKHDVNWVLPVRKSDVTEKCLAC